MGSELDGLNFCTVNWCVIFNLSLKSKFVSDAAGLRSARVNTGAGSEGSGRCFVK